MLRGLMQSDSERAMPIIEQMLAGTNSPKVKDRALFVLSQSNLGPGARDHVQHREGHREPRHAAARDQRISGSWAAPTTARSSPTSTAPRPTRQSSGRSSGASWCRATATRLLVARQDRNRGRPARRSGPAARRHGRARRSSPSFTPARRRSTSRSRIIQAMFVGGSADKLDRASREPRKT